MEGGVERLKDPSGVGEDGSVQEQARHALGAANPTPVTDSVSAVLGNKDLLELIFSFLPPWQLDASASRVSRFFHRIARTPRLWQGWTLRLFGPEKGRRVLEEDWRAFFLRPHRAEGLVARHKTGSVRGVPVTRVAEILRVEQRRNNDPDKVEFSWDFCVARRKVVHRCSMWDWKGSGQWGEFSTFGPHHVFEELFQFGTVHVTNGW
jgi:hypothetical protein